VERFSEKVRELVELDFNLINENFPGENCRNKFVSGVVFTVGAFRFVTK
jgi:hypothetical protein